MPDIKTKNVVKGTVKTIDKSAVAAERMKDAYIRTKDKAEHGVYSAEGSAEEYAADRISGCADTVTREAVRQFEKQGRRNHCTAFQSCVSGSSSGCQSSA